MTAYVEKVRALEIFDSRGRQNNKYNSSLDLCLKLAHALDTDLNSLFWDGGNYNETKHD